MAIYNPYEASSLKDAWRGLRAIDFDGRELPNAAISQDVSDVLEANTLTNRFLYFTAYRIAMSEPIPDFLKSIRFSYYLQCDWTGVTAFPDAPASAPALDYLFYYQRVDTASSLGTTGISDVPTNWRNYSGLFRINLERNELTSAQQVGIVNGIEREILAGLSEAYTSTSTTNRYIDFQNTSSGANDTLVQADLVAQGWTVVNANQMEKFISANGATARRWRVLHN